MTVWATWSPSFSQRKKQKGWGHGELGEDQTKPIQRPAATTPIHKRMETKPAILAPAGKSRRSSQAAMLRCEVKWKMKAWRPASAIRSIFKRNAGLAYILTASDENSRAPVAT